MDKFLNKLDTKAKVQDYVIARLKGEAYDPAIYSPHGEQPYYVLLNFYEHQGHQQRQWLLEVLPEAAREACRLLHSEMMKQLSGLCGNLKNVKKYFRDWGNWYEGRYDEPFAVEWLNFIDLLGLAGKSFWETRFEELLILMEQGAEVAKHVRVAGHALAKYRNLGHEEWLRIMSAIFENPRIPTRIVGDLLGSLWHEQEEMGRLDEEHFHPLDEVKRALYKLSPQPYYCREKASILKEIRKEIFDLESLPWSGKVRQYRNSKTDIPFSAARTHPPMPANIEGETKVQWVRAS